MRTVDLKDQGEYECTAANHGQERAAAMLTVRKKIEIVEGPSDQETRVFTSIKVNVYRYQEALVHVPVQFRFLNQLGCIWRIFVKVSVFSADFHHC